MGPDQLCCPGGLVGRQHHPEPALARAAVARDHHDCGRRPYYASSPTPPKTRSRRSRTSATPSRSTRRLTAPTSESESVRCCWPRASGSLGQLGDESVHKGLRLFETLRVAVSQLVVHISNVLRQAQALSVPAGLV